MNRAEIVIIGGGAAGLMAAIQAGRANTQSIVVLDGAPRIGAKILIAGGGRCNVTNTEVNAGAFAGSDRRSIDRVLRRFSVPRAIEFFQDLGVELKQEPNGKLFPITDRAQTVLQALLKAVKDAGVRILCSHRVETVKATKDSFVISGEWGNLEAAAVILATGGKSVPQTGSDGHGYQIAKSMGHSLTASIFPALVPLTVNEQSFIRGLAGISANATAILKSGTGRTIARFTNSLLLTHFGLSGPAILDISRYVIDARSRDDQAHLVLDWLPESNLELLEKDLIQSTTSTAVSFLKKKLPVRLAEALVKFSDLEPEIRLHQVKREERKTFLRCIKEFQVPLSGNRGFRYAEVTAGGVPLSELHLNTMESRVQKRLYICGEICDVDGRIGGYNFQWAWASGTVAGLAAAK